MQILVFTRAVDTLHLLFPEFTILPNLSALLMLMLFFFPFHTFTFAINDGDTFLKTQRYV